MKCILSNIHIHFPECSILEKTQYDVLCNDISFLLSFVYKKFEWNDSYETSTSIFQNGTFWKRQSRMFPLISFPLFFFLFKKLTLWRLHINFWFCLSIKKLMCSYSVTKRHKWTEHKLKEKHIREEEPCFFLNSLLLLCYWNNWQRIFVSIAIKSMS